MTHTCMVPIYLTQEECWLSMSLFQFQYWWTCFGVCAFSSFFSLKDLKGPYAQYNSSLGWCHKELAFPFYGCDYWSLSHMCIESALVAFCPFSKVFLLAINHFSPPTTVLLQISINWECTEWRTTVGVHLLIFFLFSGFCLVTPGLKYV